MNTAPSTLQLRVGGRYLSRRGEVVEIIGESEQPEWPFEDTERRTYRPDGSYSFFWSAADLIAEAPAEPALGPRRIPRRIAELESRIRVLESRLQSPVAADGQPTTTTTTTTIDPGPGYRLVVQGELIETGDEWWAGGEWCENGVAGCKLCIDTPLRRRIAAPAPEAPARDRIFRAKHTEWRVPADGGPAQFYNIATGTHLGESGATLKVLLESSSWIREVVAPAPEAPARERIFRDGAAEWRVPADGGPIQLFNARSGEHLGEACQQDLDELLRDPHVREVESLEEEKEEEEVTSKPVLQLRVGGRYLDRLGRVVTITTDKGRIDPWPFWGDNNASYRPCGSASFEGPGHPVPWDLVAEAPAVEDTPPQLPTYRLLRPGEQIRPGDEFLFDVGEPGEPSVWVSEQPPTSQVYEPEVYPPIRRQVAFYEDSPTD